jgi:hypothetical protein
LDEHLTFNNGSAGLSNAWLDDGVHRDVEVAQRGQLPNPKLLKHGSMVMDPLATSLADHPPRHRGVLLSDKFVDRTSLFRHLISLPRNTVSPPFIRRT